MEVRGCRYWARFAPLSGLWCGRGDETVEAATLVPRERVQQWTAKQVGDVPRFREETIDEVSLVPLERVQQLTAEQIGDVPQILGETVEIVNTTFRSVFLKGAMPSKCPRCQGSVEVVKTPPRSGFLHGASLSECPKFHAVTVSRWSEISLRSEVLSGCVNRARAQTSCGSVCWSRKSISPRAWSMIRLHELSSVKGFVNGVCSFGHLLNFGFQVGAHHRATSRIRPDVST